MLDEIIDDFCHSLLPHDEIDRIIGDAKTRMSGSFLTIDTHIHSLMDESRRYRDKLEESAGFLEKTVVVKTLRCRT